MPRVCLALLALAVASACRSGTTESAPTPPPVPPGARVAAPTVEAGLSVARPFELTASDGTGLTLVSVRADAVVEAPLALTELHLVFENPEPRVVEGRFRITLPEGAALSRFAMRIGEHWQEGEVLERRTAQRVYEDFLHRRQDPALLEQQAGNEFAARVFPIPARGRKELIVSYSQAMVGADARFRLPLRGLPPMKSLHARVLAREKEGAPLSPKVVLEKADWKPDVDLELPLSQVWRPAVLRSGTHVLARVSPPVDEASEPLAAALLLVDTSASRALGFGRQLSRLEELVRALQARGLRTLSVAAFDQEVVAVYEGEAADFGEEALARLRERRALGASDVGRALAWAAEHPAARVILLGDGVTTAGERSGSALAQAVRGLASKGTTRLDVVAVGGLRDGALLASLVGAGLPKAGLVLEGELPVEQLVHRLTHAVRSGLAVSVAGAHWVWPTRIDGVQPGDEVLVHAELPEEAALSVRVGETEMVSSRTVTAKAEPLLLQRSGAGARIASLLAELERLEPDAKDARGSLHSQIVAASIRHRVVSPLTALLVLETEKDYARYGFERGALADIVGVGPQGLVVVARSALPSAPSSALEKKLGMATPPTEALRNEEASSAPEAEAEEGPPADEAPGSAAAPPPPPPAPARERMAPMGLMGGLGSRAAGSGSHGEGLGLGGLSGVGTRGSGGGAGGRAALAPAGSRMHVEEVFVEDASIAKEGVERTIRRRGGELRYCYERMLSSTPSLGALRLTVRLRLDTAGRVSMADVQPEAGEASQCIQVRVRRWHFPFEPNEEVAVWFRVRLEPGQGETPTAPPPASLVRLDVLDVDGSGASRGALEGALARHEEGLLACTHDTATLSGVDTEVQLGISEAGRVTRVGLVLPGREALRDCLVEKLRGLQLDVRPLEETSARVRLRIASRFADEGRRQRIEPLTGRLAEVMQALASRHVDEALTAARAWQSEAPGDVLALVALGEAAEAKGEKGLAARAYGSVIDLYASRADLRRFAAGRLERLEAEGLALALDSYREAAEQRPDHASSHHLLGLALLRAGHPAEAFEAFARGLGREYPSGRFAGAREVLAEDLGLAAAAWAKKEPKRAGDIRQKLKQAGGRTEEGPSLRFLMTWETDANDVDFHIRDARGGHAYYQSPQLASGGRLYADVTTGYGPECFTLRGPKSGRAAPYWLEAHYYSRGPMGYGMGKLDVVEHDGRGTLRFETRPFVVMQDQAFVELGRVADAR